MDDHSDLGFKPEAAANPHADLGFQPEQKPEAPGILSQIGSSLKNTAKGYFDAMSAMTAPAGTLVPGQDPYKGFMDESTARQHQADAALAAQSDQWKRAKEHYDKGEYGQAIVHAIPIVGPLVDKWQAGRKAEAITDVAAPLAVGGLMKAGAAGARAASEPAYQSALKPGVADAPTLGDAAAQVRTGIQNEIPVTQAGANKLSNLIGDYQNKIRGVVDEGDRTGLTVDSNRVASRINDVRDRFSQQVNPTKDLKTIDASRQEFLERQGFKPAQPAQPPQPTGVLDANGQPVMKAGAPAVPPQKAQPIPVGQAQSLKIGTYQQNKAKFGEMSTAQTEAEKGLARGLKEELETRIPELKGLNEQEGKLLDLQGSLERAVRRSGNRDLIGLGDAAATGAGAIAGGPAGAAVTGFLKRVWDNPGFKSRLAITLSKAKGPSGKTIGYAAAASRVASAFEDIQNQAEGGDDSVQFKPGDLVHLVDGSQVKIKKLNGDGTFQH